MANKNKQKQLARIRRKNRLRNKIKGTPERPRLNVYRSLNHIYAQLIDDTTGRSLACVSSLSKSLRGEVEDARKKGGKVELSRLVGREIAKKALEMKIDKVVFDRNGFLYHGRIKAVAEGAREGGLKF